VAVRPLHRYWSPPASLLTRAGRRRAHGYIDALTP